MSTKKNIIKTVTIESGCKMNNIKNNSKENDKLCDVISKESK